jgi:hypothetical protein
MKEILTVLDFNQNEIDALCKKFIKHNKLRKDLRNISSCFETNHPKFPNYRYKTIRIEIMQSEIN